MSDADVTFVLLYRTPRRWRISVMAEGFACGALDTPPDAPFEVAQREFVDALRDGWGFTGELRWTETRPGHWSGEPIPTRESA